MMSAPLPDWIAAVMRAWRSLALIVSSVTSTFICLLYSAISRLSSASPSGMKSTHCRRWSFVGWAKAGATPPPAARSPSALEVLRKLRREIVVMCRLLASFGDRSDGRRVQRIAAVRRALSSRFRVSSTHGPAPGEGFQGSGRVGMRRRLSRWARREREARRMPELVATAFRAATSGGPGPVYLDLPGDVLGEAVEEASVPFPARSEPTPRAQGDPAAIAAAVALLARAERPLVIGGSGVWWSDAASAFQTFVDTTGIPFYTTPISRGMVADDHALAFLNARARAFAEADVLLAVGTRFNYVLQFGRPPRFAADLKVIHVDVNPSQLGANRRVDVPIVGYARAVPAQLVAEP